MHSTIARSTTDYCLDNSMLDIFSTIDSAANNGYYSVKLYNLTESEKNRLKNLDYEIINEFLDTYTVSW